MRNSIRNWILLLATLVLVAVAVVAPRLWQQKADQASQDAASEDGDTTVTVTSSCDLRKGDCNVPLRDGASASFRIDPLSIPSMTPLSLHAKVHGLDIEQASVLFEGKSMYMGQNRVTLTKAPADEFVGEAVVPACTMDDKMVWQAALELSTSQGDYRVLFEFVANQ